MCPYGSLFSLSAITIIPQPSNAPLVPHDISICHLDAPDDEHMCRGTLACI